MRLAHSIFPILGCFLMTVGLFSCQKASLRPVKAQLGQGSATPNSVDQKMDEVLKSNKTIQCPAGFEEKYKSLTNHLEKTNAFLSENKGQKLDEKNKLRY